MPRCFIIRFVAVIVISELYFYIIVWFDAIFLRTICSVLRVILKYCSHLSGSGSGGKEVGGAKKGTIAYKCLKSSYNVLDKVRHFSYAGTIGGRGGGVVE